MISVFFGLSTLLAADSDFTDGLVSIERGAFDVAASRLEKAVQKSRRAGKTGKEIEGLIHLAAAYQGLGQHRRAVEILDEAVGLAEKLDQRETLVRAKSKLGAGLILVRQTERAEKVLRESLEMAKTDRADALTAAIQNDLGNLLAAQQKSAEALELFEASAEAARKIGNKKLTAQALCNAAANAPNDKAEALNGKALEEINSLGSSHEKAFLLLTAAQTDRRIKSLVRALKSSQRALEIAEELKDRPMTTYALGQIGQLYEDDKQIDHAMGFTRRAAFVAQQAQMPEALYRWEWQAGRLLKAQGKFNEAIASYRGALQTLQPIRHDVALGYGNNTSHASFRETLGPLFFELADLLLVEADKDAAKSQALLREARQTVEQLKAVELEDYFQDDCCDVQRNKVADVENVDPKSAVVYLIPLPNRTEMLVSLKSGMHRFKSDIGSEALMALVREFRRNLETRTTYGYLEQGQKLYDVVIRPVRPLLLENKVDTVVFIPAGALQTIPFATLYDGTKFLIEEFAVATAPGLSLVEPRPIEREKAQLLMSGLSDSVQGFPALDFVPGELDSINAQYSGEKFLNESFVTAALQKKLTEEQFSIVHIASHGQFNSDARKTFVLTYDGKLSLNDLESVVRPSQYRGKPVELLVLSACQTAAGDDRAALGLAGVAVKAGARSAIATLWFVNDESTAAFTTEVYRQLRQTSAVSRARAVQAAQIKMLQDRRFQHPCYWAPYLLIGNWL